MGSDQGILDEVIAFASAAHEGQFRRYRKQDPYITHPLRVMESCRRYTSDLAILAGAVLHDVLEDTLISAEQLRQFLGQTMSQADAMATFDIVLGLTDVFTKNSYPHKNRRTRKNLESNRLSRLAGSVHTIKYADILDNVPETVEEDPEFARRFLLEYKALLKVMNKGNPELYQMAVSTVEKGIEKLKTII